MLPVIKTRSMMPNWIEEFFGNDFYNNDPVVNATVPSVNVIEGNDNFRIEVAAPGLRKEDFKIELDNNLLKISSERKHEDEVKQDEKILRREFSYCSFKRTFSLPDTVQSTKIDASHQNGILSIVIPKKEEAKVQPVKQIEIR
jgi:HSP20 family protein